MKPHVLVINPWNDRCVHYTDYLDHDRYAVSYIGNPWSVHATPSCAAARRTVEQTSTTPQVLTAAIDLARQFGHPERVIAFSESDLDTAAALRSYFDLPGDRWSDIQRFRDKLHMAETIAANGIPAPAFADAPNRAAIENFIEEHGFPIVVKPRRGAGSRGFLKLDTIDDLATIRSLPDEARLVQSYCAADVGHIDGFWTGTTLSAWRASRCPAPPSEYLRGRPYASVEIDDPALRDRLSAFTSTVCGAMSSKPFVFHLEVFMADRFDGGWDISFLEIGARVGGAEIPFVWNEIHHRDLFSVAADLQLGRQPDIAAIDDGTIGGWMVVPPPEQRPCAVLAAELDLPLGSGPYAMVLPTVGTEIPAMSGYEHCGGRFRFSGPSSAAVEDKIRRTVAAFHLACAPIEHRSPIGQMS